MISKLVFKRFNWIVVVGLVVLWVGASFAAAPAGGTLKWKKLTKGSVFSNPAIGLDGTIYCGSYDTYIYALNPDGIEKWKYRTNGGVESSPTIGPCGTIYCGSQDHHIYALNPDGTLKWKYQTEYLVTGTPAIGLNGTIYCGSGHYMYALNPDGSLQWKFDIKMGVGSSPTIGSGGTIYFGSLDYYIYALNQNGTLKWRYYTWGQVRSTPAIGQDGTIYFGSLDSYIYALEPNKGNLKWRYLTGGWVFSSPALGSDGTIYCGSLDSYIYALKPDGSLKWTFLTGDSVTSSPALSSDGTIYCGSYDDYIYALNPDKTLKWKYLTGDSVVSSPAIGSDGTVYCGSADKYIHAINNSISHYYYIPVFKHPSASLSGFAATNLSNARNASISIAIYNPKGNLIGTETKTIAANGQASFILGTSLTSNGWIKVTSTEKLAGLSFLGKYNGTTDLYIANVPFAQTLSEVLKIPHVDQNSIWDTIVFLANPNGLTASVLLIYANKSGTVSSLYATSIPANGSKEIPVSIIGNSTSIHGGSVTIASSQSLTACALINNFKTGNHIYVGIDAVDVSKDYNL